MISYIVLAQGKGERLKAVLGDLPKQALPLTRRRSILQRTLWMLDDLHRRAQPRPPYTVTVVGPESLRSHVGDHALVTLADPGLCVLDGIAQTSSYWPERGRTVILLGDVIWAWQDFVWAIRGMGPVQFTHTADLTPSTGEIFAAMWSSDVNPLVARCLDDAPCRHGRHGQDYAGVAQPGHLRNLKRLLDAQLGRYSRSMVTAKFTKDIDTPEDYKRLPELAALAELDDVGMSDEDELAPAEACP
jgi:hypothetical protein